MHLVNWYIQETSRWNDGANLYGLKSDFCIFKCRTHWHRTAAVINRKWDGTRKKSGQAGENPGRERMSDKAASTPGVRLWGTQPLHRGTNGVPTTGRSGDGHETLDMKVSGGPSTREEYWGDIQKVCRKGWINPASSSPNAEPIWPTEKKSAQLSSYQKTR